MSALETINLMESTAPTRDEADYVIIGTGPGGASAGRVLAEAGFDVIFVEEGRRQTPKDVRADGWTSFKNAWRDQSMQVAQGRAIWPILQGCAVGGTTPINGAIIHRLPDVIHAKWASEQRLGDYLTLDRLSATFDRLDSELSVAPVEDAKAGNNNLLFAKGADALGWKHNAIQRNVRGCEETSRCNQMCPAEAKQSMDRTFLPTAQRFGARIYERARAAKILQKGGRASGVSGTAFDPVTGQRGAAFEFSARRGVLVAAGAIHTPVLLKKSGVGRRSGLVGKRFMGHPGTSVLIEFDSQVDMFRGATQGHESTNFWDEGMKFEVVGLPPGVAGARLPGFGQPLMERLDALPFTAHWGLQIRAEAVGSVSPGLFGGRPSIRYSFTDGDVQKFKLALSRVVEMAFAAGAKRVMPGVAGLPEAISSVDEIRAIFDLPNNPRLFHGICAHLFGTSSMGGDERSGVVNEFGESYDLPGLYVVDASVLPTNMGVNPQHTICAFSWLIAEAMATRAPQAI